MSENYAMKSSKKKKKKSYLSRAKKFGKSGRFGNGSYVNEDTYNYFLRVVEINKGKFDTKEEKEIFISNTFEQTLGQEVTLATNQFTSYAIEQLIPGAKHECLEKFMTALAIDLRPICNDSFASHVIQSLLKCASDRVQELLQSDEENCYIQKYIEWVLKIGKFLLNNIEEFVWETYANPIMRTVLEVISGSEVTHNKKEPTKKIEPVEPIKIPKLLRVLLTDYCKIVASLPQLSDLTSSPLTSGFLQSLVKAAARGNSKKLTPLIEKLFAVLKNKNSLDEPSFRLLEAMLMVAPSSFFSQLFETFFQGKLKFMSCASDSNFCVQRLFDSCSDKDQLQLLLEEMCSATILEEIINAGYTGVLLAMGKACHRLTCGQGTFIQNLMTVLQCHAPELQIKVAPLVLALLPQEKYDKKLSMRVESDPPLVTLHGSLLLQTLLNFNKPFKLIQSLLAMEPSYLTAVLCDTKGSHVTDSFMNSTYVGEKSREKLCHHLKGKWTDIACSIWGSRSLDSIWKASSLKIRQGIVAELAQHISRLKGDKHGRFIVEEYGVELYRRKPQDWTDTQSKSQRKKKIDDKLSSIFNNQNNKKFKKE